MKKELLHRASIVELNRQTGVALSSGQYDDELKRLAESEVAASGEDWYPLYKKALAEARALHTQIAHGLPHLSAMGKALDEEVSKLLAMISAFSEKVAELQAKTDAAAMSSAKLNGWRDPLRNRIMTYGFGSDVQPGGITRLSDWVPHYQDMVGCE
ncbi:hypothetical protein [Sinorhizobium meliloti]|uniref:hypothetical protein n=1 Tax=Rhizobium meliloti TaxID=382 RepID=UPI000FD5D924|nr:hypothetical protein [Sinorhizobium meliloti]RVJ99194.1 hypothetical protein CN173_06895 [Sinorhizobium meliloti]